MHGIGRIAPLLNLLVGIELTQVCVGFSDVVLNFGPEGRVSVFAPSFFEDNAAFLLGLFGSDPEKSPFGKQITNADIVGDVLRLELGNGSEILIRDDSSAYESAHFEIRGADEVV
jgi:hypothetical protein